MDCLSVQFQSIALTGAGAEIGAHSREVKQLSLLVRSGGQNCLPSPLQQILHLAGDALTLLGGSGLAPGVLGFSPKILEPVRRGLVVASRDGRPHLLSRRF
jgi:hypothetical protein